jgi:hypothetical protein
MEEEEEEETGGMQQQQQQGILEEIHSQRRLEERSLHPTIGFLQYLTTGFFVEYAQQLESLNTEQQQQQQQQQEEEEEEEEEFSLQERRREKKRICNRGRTTTSFQGAQAAVTQSAAWSESRGPPRLSLWVVVVSISRRSRGRLVSYTTISG